ncbi:hypothetical protein ARALYDRAFT_920541 [Arabidopsis lyrata subsp. lyrata]|uniref:Uncharacterized protein n=2 Tax=Arabidopsis lyrata subsp. lyrata TaxID=81972 RepID=D7MXB7_ARALL|nr:hypothetical protein ARALYDRAFT_920541 [Arabidopsis lyrata subsp. lyrata]
MKLEEDDKTFLRAKEKSTSQSSKGSGLRAKPDDSVSMHQRVCLKELEEGLEKRTRRDNKLQLKKKSSCQVFNLSMSSEGDKIHPESSPRNVDDHESQEKSRTFSKILPRNVNVMIREDNHRTLKDKLMEARVESRRLRSSLKPE